MNLILILKKIFADIDPIAAWGAILSTILVIVKFVDMWRNRSRIETDYFFTSDVEEGNLVKIRNISSKPIIIKHWELICKHRHWLKWNQDWIMESDPIVFDDIKINGHSYYNLIFSEGEYFNWDFKSRDNKKIYICLYLAGRKRPLLKKVYG